MLSKALSRMGTGAARHPWRVIAAWLLAAIAAVAATAEAGEGIEAARGYARRGAFDAALDRDLAACFGPDHSLLARVLAIEEAARLGLAVALGPRLLLGAELSEASGIPAIRAVDADDPVRFGPLADSLLLVGDEVRLARRDSLVSDAVESSISFPYARLAAGYTVPLAVPADLIERRWTLMLCAEIAGNLRGALDRLVDHLGHRMQFGTSLGQLQALRHRVSEAKVDVESVSWLTRYAACADDSPEALLDAAAQADEMAGRLITELTQLAGARGFVLEFGLQVWTMRAFGLRAELIGRLRAGADSYRGRIGKQAV